MVKIYVDLIKAGRRTIDDVPAPLREVVREALEKELARSNVAVSAADVVSSLNSKSTKTELQQACDKLGIAYDGTETKAELRALIDAATA